MRAAVYTRISKDRSGLSANTGIQLSECHEYCAEQGWDVVAAYEENDISASRYSTKPRPLYQQLIGLVRAGKVDVIVATEGERLMRRPDEMSALIDLAEQHPLRIALTNDDGYDLTDADGIYRARTAVALAERESRKISRRQKRKKAAQARQGLPTGGRRPYGYEADMVTVNEAEAAALGQMADKVLHGWGFNSVATWANAQGYLTTTGRPFLGVTVCNMLKKPRYAGLRQYHEATYPAVWPAIFDAQTWERLQIELRLRSERNVPKARTYLLTGLLECGKCGGKLNGSKKRDRPGKPTRRTYICISCRKLRRNADALDWYVRELVIYRLDSPDMAALLKPDDDGQLKALLELRELRQAKLNHLVDDYAEGLLTREQFARAKATAEALLAETEAELDRATRQAAGIALSAGHTLKEAWDANPTEWRRSLIELLVKKVTVLPTNKKPYVDVDGKAMRFDRDGVVIEWLA